MVTFFETAEFPLSNSVGFVALALEIVEMEAKRQSIVNFVHAHLPVKDIVTTLGVGKQ